MIIGKQVTKEARQLSEKDITEQGGNCVDQSERLTFL